ncbi:ShlB/FhaC/HecB family hemolysin secretion/activation protein [Herbaspirillum sp.]|uniref:ShlB/FhaC/HecB family hemolysin secretion/activation protein n=1 Tax=Herbaspirillum sp. TaxID=1890675 RepID=UPI001B18374D|nr:ShlB/FhaC/HecB family hemolysin secretion/activation protein [Herbaspirillum sp.]MBO9535702.1 ShlB/FhaC/HecB family hemolysin secretion/activation protein [Herbaspirillum sp.]
MMSASSPAFLLKPLAAALLLATLDAHAAGPGTPDSGAILQQLQPGVPAAAPSNAPTLQIAPRSEAGLPASAPFEVKHLRITGNTAFATEILHALVADQEGQRLTLEQLNALAGRITAYYQNHGFPLARAIIPAQTISDGVVVIQVVEAHYGQVSLNNRSKVGDPVLNAILAPLQGGQAIAGNELDRTLLLLSDVPGVGLSASLKPGAAVGTSDLDIEANDNPAAPVSLALDNYGNRYVGRTRLSGNISLLNPLHHGDILSASLLTTGNGMNYGRVSYDTLVSGSGTRVGAAYSYLRYKLGSELNALGANGTAGVASLWARQPLLRGKQANLYAQVQYDAKRLRDHIDSGGVNTDRHLANWVLSLNGDLRDSLLAGGFSAWSLGWTNGRVVFDDAAAASADDATARTRGGFSKWNANVSRLQGLGQRDTLYVSLAAQWADSNLDSAEKMTAGGPFSVRAYDIGAASGDTGYLGTVEWRHDLGSPLAGQWQALAFIDSAYVKANRRPWSTAENSATLSGAGVGLNWIGPDLWRASAALATRIGGLSSLVARQSSVRAWMTLSKGF